MAELHGPWRRTRWTALVGAAVFASAAPLSLGGAEAADAPGQGTASAQAWKIDPKAGGLSIGITFGQATANHQNEVAKAFSHATNMGVVGTTLAAEGCDGSAPTWPRDQQPQALVVDSRDANAANGVEVREREVFRKYGKASNVPFAEATTHIGPFIGPGIEMGGGIARTTSGMVGNVREARAIVEITSLNLGNVVRMASIRWEAVHQSTGAKTVAGRLTIGYASVNGQPLNTQDPSAVLAAANAALTPIGFRLTPGATRVAGDIVTVDPLAISVIPNAVRDQVAGTAIGAAQPARKALIDAILGEPLKYCKAGTYISVIDIAVGSITGAGEFVLSLGGVQATSGDMPKNEFKLDLGAVGTDPGLFIPGLDPTITTMSGGAGTSGVLPSGGAGRGGTRAGIPGRGMPIGHRLPVPFKGTRGGALAVVGLVTLAVVALVAEGDRRKMRAALRQMAEAAE